MAGLTGNALVVADSVTVVRGPHTILQGLSLGVHEGDRIGVVGRNGGGKSTLLDTLAGGVSPDGGRITMRSGTRVEMVSQRDDVPGSTVGEAVLAGLTLHEALGTPLVRDVLTGLLGGVTAPLLAVGLHTPVTGLSGGESRRVALAAALIHGPDVLLLDEPTNHLDITGVSWLAAHLQSRPARSALVVVTHDRWFLDAVTTATWEVVAGGVEAYEGGYAAYVLAKAERDRQSRASTARRNNLLRKELAWLQRGAPARTSKPKYRRDAAAELIADEPPPRDGLVLRRVAGARLGRTVVELDGVTLRPAASAPPVLREATWGIGPGDRIGLLGRNGVGKTTLMRLILGQDVPVEGRVRRGATVRAAILDQHIDDGDPESRILPWLQEVGERITVSTGDDLTASVLLERFGFAGDAAWKRLGDLSGGERRRLQLLRVLLSGPNVLVLDEPTNDLDVETLTVLEDLLDQWPGSLVVVSHDRYFLERVCDDIWAMPGDGGIRHLPGGVAQYLADASAEASESPEPARTTGKSPAAADRDQRKRVARAERAMSTAQRRIDDIHQRMSASATDPVALAELGRELSDAEGALASAEDDWLTLVE